MIVFFFSLFCFFFFCFSSFFFFNDTATTEIYTLSLHDALPISRVHCVPAVPRPSGCPCERARWRSEEHTSELQSLRHLVCRLLLEKKKKGLAITVGTCVRVCTTSSRQGMTAEPPASSIWST